MRVCVCACMHVRVRACVRLTLGLSGGVVDLQVKGLCVGPLHHRHVAPGPLVGLGQRVGPPVRPVHLPPVHGDREGVRQELVAPQHLDQPAAVVQRRVDGIRPEGGGRVRGGTHRYAPYAIPS